MVSAEDFQPEPVGARPEQVPPLPDRPSPTHMAERLAALGVAGRIVVPGVVGAADGPGWYGSPSSYTSTIRSLPADENFRL